MSPDETLPVPKYYRIAEDIRNRIIRKEFAPGGRIPSSRELIAHYRTTAATIVNVLRKLNEDGLVDSRRGLGTFVAAARPAQKRRILAMTLVGDYFDEMQQALRNTLEESRDVTLYAGNFTESEDGWQRTLEDALADEVDTLVFLGVLKVPYRVLARYAGKFRQLIAVCACDWRLPFPGLNRVLIDWRAVGRCQAAHLLGRNRRKLLLVDHPYLDTDPARCGSIPRDSEDRIAGFRETAEAAGATVTVYRRRAAHTVIAPDFHALLDTGDFDGVAVLNDFWCKDVYGWCRRHGKTPGREIGVCGLYNTPWTQIFLPELSSVEVFSEKIGRAVADCIREDRRDFDILIQPEFIARDS